MVHMEAIAPGSYYGELVCRTLLKPASISFRIRHQLSILRSLHIKILPKILNLKNSGNILQKFSTPLGKAKCEQWQHSTCKLILSCNSKYKKSVLDARGLLSSHLTLIPSECPFPDLSKLKNLISSCVWFTRDSCESLEQSKVFRAGMPIPRVVLYALTVFLHRQVQTVKAQSNSNEIWTHGPWHHGIFLVTNGIELIPVSENQEYPNSGIHCYLILPFKILIYYKIYWYKYIPKESSNQISLIIILLMQLM